MHYRTAVCVCEPTLTSHLCVCCSTRRAAASEELDAGPWQMPLVPAPADEVAAEHRAHAKVSVPPLFPAHHAMTPSCQ